MMATIVTRKIVTIGILVNIFYRTFKNNIIKKKYIKFNKTKLTNNQINQMKLFIASLFLTVVFIIISLDVRSQCNLQGTIHFSPDSSYHGKTIHFNSTVTGGPLPYTYLWDFGDSTVSSLTQPTHQYSFSGCGYKTYIVSLRVIDNLGCTLIINKPITVKSLPVPKLLDVDIITPFSNCDNNPSNSNPTFPLTVMNGTLDSSNVSYYQISWGDGTPIQTVLNSNFQITHTYAQLGLFNLVITAFDNMGCSSSTNYAVSNQGNPAVGISSLGNTQGCAPQTFKFVLSQYQSNAPGTYYVWDFGDGSPQVTWNYNQPFINDTVQHTFLYSSCTISGNFFIVSVTAYNSCDYTSAQVGNIRIYSAPIAGFMPSADTGCVNTQICFSNQTMFGFGFNCTTNATYAWNFGDPASGANNTSSLANPCHTYSTPGIYTVTLQALNSVCGNTTSSKQIVINAPPVAYINHNPSSGCIPLSVNFNNNSIGGNLTYSWSVTPSNGWNFVSPSNASSKNPEILIFGADTFFANLTVKNNCGIKDTTVTINAFQKPSAILSSIPNACGSTLLTPSLNVNSFGTPITNYSWNFPGGNPVSATISNPNNIVYSTPGTYTVNAIATNLCGPDTVSQTFIVYPIPTVKINTNFVKLCEGDSVILTASGANNYQWGSSLSNLTTTGSQVTLKPTLSSMYYVKGTNTLTSCYSYDSIFIQITPNPVLIISPLNPSICLGDTAKLTITGASSYFWSPATGLNTQTGSQIIANPSATTTYTVLGIDNNGCYDSKNVTVTVLSLPSISISPLLPAICLGDSITISATGALNYNWAPTNGLSSKFGSTVKASPQSTQLYTVEGTGVNGCKQTNSIAVVVNPLPNLTINATPSTICLGNTTQLSASGASVYNWYPSMGLSSTTGQVVTAQPQSTMFYKVIGTANGCSKTDSILITVNNSPTLSITPVSPHICIGDSVVITATGANSYLWSPSSTLSSAVGSQVVANPSSSTLYQLIGIDNYGCTDSINFNVIVSSYLTIAVTPAQPTLCLGDSITLTASGANNYFWSPSTGLSSTTGNIVKASPTATTLYTVTGNASAGCFNDTSFTLTVLPKPIVSISSSNTTICVGQSTTLSASGADSYMWSPSQGLSSTIGSSVIASPLVTTTYYVTGQSLNGCSSVDSIVIYVNLLPTIIFSPPNPSICQGDSITIIATGGNVYNWNNSQPGLSSYNSDTIIAKPLVSTTYSLLVTDNNGCSNSAVLPVVVNLKPTIILTPALSTICSGDSVLLTVSGGVSYIWSPANVLSSPNSSSTFASPSTSTIISVIGTDINGCKNSDSSLLQVNFPSAINIAASSTNVCIGQSTTLTVSGANTYVWAPGSTLNITTGNTVIATPSSSLFYTVTATDINGCKSKDSILINANQNLNLNINPNPATVCLGDSIQLQVTGAPLYIWANTPGLSAYTGSLVYAKPSSTSTYTVTGTDYNGCINSQSVIVNVNPLPIVSSAVASNSICSGDTLALSVSGANTYFWTPSLGLSSTTGQNVNASPSSSTIYTITGTNINGCKSTTNITVNVNSLPLISASVSPASICAGDTALLTSTGALSYQWTPLIGLAVNTGNSIYATPNSTVKYIVVGTDINGCSNKDSVIVNVNQKPQINVVASSSSICLGDTTLLTAQGAISYHWFPASGLNSTNSSQVKASPVVNTSYTIIGTDINGCKNSTISNITVNPLPNISFTHDSLVCNTTQTPMSNTSIGASVFAWNFGTAGTSNLFNPAFTFGIPGSYVIKLKGTSLQGCSDSATSIIQSIAAPIANFSALPDSGCGPLQVLITNNSIGSYTSFNWNMGNGILSSLSNPGNTTYNPGKHTDTSYFINLSVSNKCGLSIYQDTILVKTKPSVNFGLSHISGCSPLLISFANVTLGNPTSYYWNFGNGTFSSQANPTPKLFYGGNQDTIYTIVLKATNHCGSDTMSKQVIVKPQTVKAFFTPSVVSGCEPLSVTFQNFSTINSSIFWDFGNGNFSSAYSPTHVFHTPGTYLVKLIVNDSCSIDTAKVSITVNQKPNLNFGISKDTICELEQIFLTNYSGPLKNILWNFGDGIQSSLNNPSHIYTVPGMYKITMTGESMSSGCIDSIWRYVHVKEQPKANFALSTSDGCVPLPVSLTYNGQGNNYYLWSFGDGNTSTMKNPVHTFSTAGNYVIKLIVYNSSGCIDSSQANITVYPKPEAIFTSSLLQSCVYPVNSQFTNFSTGASGYEWTFGNSLTSSLNNPSTTFLTSGIYDVKLVALNQYNCSDTANLLVSVFEKPKSNISFLSPSDGCAPYKVELQSTSLYAISNFWYFGDGKTSLSTSPSHIYTQHGLYSLTLITTGNGGCKDTLFLKDTIRVYPTPEPDFTYKNYYEQQSNSGMVLFSNQSLYADTYSWDFGDGSSLSSNENPTHKFFANGNYQVTLFAFNNFGCKSQITKGVEKIDLVKGLFIPNAFSPNNTSSEVRVFQPKGIGIKTYHLMIYDTWGNLIWETQKLENGSPAEAWNGEFKGKMVQQDTYVWKARAVFQDESIWTGMDYGDGKPKTQGIITLLK